MGSRGGVWLGCCWRSLQEADERGGRAWPLPEARSRGRSAFWPDTASHSSDFDESRCFRRTILWRGVPSRYDRPDLLGTGRIGFAEHNAPESPTLVKTRAMNVQVQVESFAIFVMDGNAHMRPAVHDIFSAGRSMRYACRLASVGRGQL